MKTAIYLSGIIGAILLVVRMMGIMIDFHLNQVLLILGIVLLAGVFLPLIIVDNYFYRKRVEKVMDSMKGTRKKVIHFKKKKSKIKGWGMNDSPFRERKSGLTWGGGNVKGANATREPRRTFLK